MAETFITLKTTVKAVELLRRGAELSGMKQYRFLEDLLEVEVARLEKEKKQKRRN